MKPTNLPKMAVKSISPTQQPDNNTQNKRITMRAQMSKLLITQNGIALRRLIQKVMLRRLRQTLETSFQNFKALLYQLCPISRFWIPNTARLLAVDWPITISAAKRFMTKRRRATWSKISIFIVSHNILLLPHPPKSEILRDCQNCFQNVP